MKFILTQDFPVALDVLWPVYGHPDYLRAKYQALGAHEITIEEAHTDAAAIRVRLQRSIAPDLHNVPEWARKLVAHDYVMRHENDCRRESSQRAAVSLRIKPLGAPVDIHARGSLQEVNATQTRLQLEFDVQCTIPLLGKKVAEIFAGKIREALQEDFDFTLGYIRARGAAK